MEAVADETKLVPLKSIFIAPENPRATVEADDGIPQLGRTLGSPQGLFARTRFEERTINNRMRLGRGLTSRFVRKRAA